MSLVYIYSNVSGATIDITARCRVSKMSVKDQAEEGAVALSSLTIDDPLGDLTITGHRRLYIYEDTAPVGDQIIYNGFTSNERVIRGPSGRTGASRQWVVDLSDPNVLINRRVMNGTDANRPAETDLARIQALLTMTELNTVDDDTYVSTTAATTAMDAVDYRGQNVGAYIDDCRQASGKNAFIWYNEALGQYSLWYDFDNSTEYDSGKFLSNTLADIDNSTTFGYSVERTYLNIDPSRVASGIYLEFDSDDSPVYVQSATTLANFAAIDWVAPSENVKSLTKATARANRYLADASTEDRIIHVVMTDVPRAQVNAIHKGQLVSFKSSYMPGLEEYTVCRVLYRTVTEISEDPESSFEIEMDLTTRALAQVTATLLALQSGIYWSADDSTPQPYNGDGSAIIGWRFTGDTPAAGWDDEPLSGPIEYYEFDPPLERSGDPLYRGLRVNEYSVVDISHVGGFGGVALPGATITAAIRQNGTIISEQTQYWPFPPEVGFAFWPGVFTFSLLAIEVQPGDEFEVSIAVDGWALDDSWYYAVIPGENNPNSHFRIVPV